MRILPMRKNKNIFYPVFKAAVLFLLTMLFLSVASSVTAEQTFQIDSYLAYLPGQEIVYYLNPEWIARIAGEKNVSGIQTEGMICTVSDPEVLMTLTDRQSPTFLALQPGKCTVRLTTADGAYSFTENITVLSRPILQSTDWTLDGVPLNEADHVFSLVPFTLAGNLPEGTRVYLSGQSRFSPENTLIADDSVDMLDIVLVQEKNGNLVYSEKEPLPFFDNIHSVSRFQIPVIHTENSLRLQTETTEPLVSTEFSVQAEGGTGEWNIVFPYWRGNGIGDFGISNTLAPGESFVVYSYMNNGPQQLVAVEKNTGRHSGLLQINPVVLGTVPAPVPTFDGLPMTEVTDVTAGKLHRLTVPEADRDKYEIGNIDSSDNPRFIMCSGSEAMICFSPNFSGQVSLEIGYHVLPGYVWDTDVSNYVTVLLNVSEGESPVCDLWKITGNGFETRSEGLTLFMTEQGSGIGLNHFDGQPVGQTGITRYTEEEPCTMFYGTVGDLLYWLADDEGHCSPVVTDGNRFRTSILSDEQFRSTILIDGTPATAIETLTIAHSYQLDLPELPEHFSMSIYSEDETGLHLCDRMSSNDGKQYFSLASPVDNQSLYLILEQDTKEGILLYSGPIEAPQNLPMVNRDDLPQEIMLMYAGEPGIPQQIEAGEMWIVMFNLVQEHTWTLELNGEILFSNDTIAQNEGELPPILDWLDCGEDIVGDDVHCIYAYFATTEPVSVNELLLRYSVPSGEEMVYPFTAY